MFRFCLRLLLRLPTKKRLLLTGLRCRLCSVFAGVETRGVAAEARVEPPLTPRSTVMFFACLLMVFPDEFFGVPAKCMQSLIALFRGVEDGRTCTVLGENIERQRLCGFTHASSSTSRRWQAVRSVFSSHCCCGLRFSNKAFQIRACVLMFL